jgi:pimeloyl-ACP methyl ester carboxylesterase
VGDFLDEMGIARIALVCHGLGTLVGLCLAGAQISRIARIMAIALPVDLASVEGRLRGSDPGALLNLLGGKPPQAAEVLPDASAMDLAPGLKLIRPD